MAGTQLTELRAGRTGTDEPDWSGQARCRGMDPDVFFGRNLTEARTAIRTCDRCEVRQQCLEYAVSEGIDIGVWGGLTERQRRAYVRQRGRLAS